MMDEHDSSTKLNTNTIWHQATVTRARREQMNGHRAAVLWFTGLSGSGKSTIAHAVEEYLHQEQFSTFVLDGDNVRHGLCTDLGFSPPHRTENIRRISQVSKLLVEAGILAITAFISPFRSDRALARSVFPHGEFFEIWCNSNIAICEERDVKGLYRRARVGEIKEFTGISSPYEPPTNPELELDTSNQSIEACVKNVIDLLNTRGIYRFPQHTCPLT